MRIAGSQSSIVSKTQESAFVPRYFTPWNVTFQDCKYIIPYKTDQKIVNNHRGKIALSTAFEKLESNSSLKFVEHTDQERYLYFTDGYGCHSYIGQQKKTGPQDITIGDGCLYYFTIIHEVKILNTEVVPLVFRFCSKGSNSASKYRCGSFFATKFTF